VIAQIIFILFLTPLSALALTSNFPATVMGTKITNVHQLSERVLRGNSPVGNVSDLKNLGVTDVLIFKKSSQTEEIQEEVGGLRGLGYTTENIFHIPFPWKNLPGDAASCRMILDGLRLMVKINSQPGRKIFVHCSVGEDRTGVISGLFRMLNDGWKSKKAFHDELCAHGYANASRKKPKKVADAIRYELTPLYVAIAEKIEAGEISGENLSSDLCDGIKLKSRAAVEKRGYLCRPLEF